jgi:nitroreductase
MDAYEALYTTRAMRRLKKDPIPASVQKRILDAAIRAPSGGNTQGWRFLLVDDPAVKAQLGPLYRSCMDVRSGARFYKSRRDAAEAAPKDPESIEFMKMYRSADHLAQHFEDVPLMLFAFCQFDTSRRLDLPGRLERDARRPRRGRRELAHERLLPQGRRAEEGPRRPRRGRLELQLLRDLRLSDGQMGGRPAAPGARGRLPQRRGGAPLGFEIPEPLWKKA